ncbi:MAG TPA: hypothetical protein VJY11_00290 [Erysipelothrix sp.]|nr:hypothetical protein [Erysipelothrix sp.]
MMKTLKLGFLILFTTASLIFFVQGLQQVSPDGKTYAFLGFVFYGFYKLIKHIKTEYL